jgi:phospholipid transport system substrate-binding protein
MKNRIAVKTLVVLFFSFSLFSVVDREARAGEATNQIKGTIDEVIEILNIKELKKPEKEKDRQTRIRATIEKRFDFAEMAKRSLGIYWKQRTPEEQKEFTSLFSDLLEDTYVRKIERYEDEKVEYSSEKVEGSYADVKTIIKTTKGTEIPVDYRIFKEGEKWEVYDIIVEGVSLVNNYRTQFNDIIHSSSYGDLVKRLKKKSTKGS